MTEPTVFIIDDDEAVCDSIKELIDSVGLKAETYCSALDYLDTFDPARPGCLVLDVRMAHLSGLALQARLNQINARIPIVFISGHGDIPTVVNTIRAGAVDFVQKPYRDQQLLDSINEALRRDAALRQNSTSDSLFEDRLLTLTEREREVMELAIKGLSSKLIAKQLNISPRTVEVHRSRLLNKLAVDSMAELIYITNSQRN